MKVSVIISTYKRTDNLSLILQALDRQTCNSFEVIISEDDHNPEMAFYISVEQRRHMFPILHLNQDADEGFRKNQMLNRSITAAKGSLLIFLDGDCIPHRSLVEEYVRHARSHRVMTGRRVMLHERLTQQLYRHNSPQPLSLLRILTAGSRHIEEGLYLPFIPPTKAKGILGCNWAVMKDRLLEVNGYDEDYTQAAYGEDLDIEWRLLQTGCHLFSMKFRAIVYHLDHTPNYNNEDQQRSQKLWEQKREANRAVCQNGLVKPKKPAPRKDSGTLPFPSIAQAL